MLGSDKVAIYRGDNLGSTFLHLPSYPSPIGEWKYRALELPAGLGNSTTELKRGRAIAKQHVRCLSNGLPDARLPHIFVILSFIAYILRFQPL